MGQSLTKLIEAALLDGNAGVMEKIAQEAEGDEHEHEEAEHKCEECGKASVAGSKFCKECAEKKAISEEKASGMKEGEGSEKTSSARIEKLAQAVEFIRDNFLDIQMPVGRVKVADSASPDSGPGIGANSLETNLKKVTSGEAPEGFGEAKTKKPDMTVPLEAGASPNAASTAIKTTADAPPGGSGEQPQMTQTGGTGGDKPQAKTASVQRIMAAMMKAAADGDMGEDSKISAPKTMDTTTPEDKPSGVERPAEVTSQERLIASNDAAIDATKREAKEVPKKRMGDVLSEPAQAKSTDSALDKALGSQVVTQAGAKVAAAQARVMLQKTASQKCTCKGEGSCGFCKIASRIGQKTAQQAGAVWETGHKPGTHARSL